MYERFLHVDGSPVLIRAWELRRDRRVAIAAMPAPPSWLDRGACGQRPRVEQLERAVVAARNALGVDDDLERVPPPLPARPAARPADPAPALAPAAARRLALGGVRLGGHRAADRVLAGRGDPAPDRCALGQRIRMPGTGAPAARRPRPRLRSPGSLRPSSRGLTSRRSGRSP